MHCVRENLYGAVKFWEQHETMATLASCSFGDIGSLCAILCIAMANTTPQNVLVGNLLGWGLILNFVVREIATVLP